MTPPPLYGTGLAHSGDPDTSHEAAQHIVASGTQGRQMTIVLDTVRRHPGLTSLALADHCDLDRYQVARRLADLKARNVVEHRGTGEQSMLGTGRCGMAWWVR